VNESQMTLLKDWDGRETTGWFWSEKLRGCRGYWQAAIRKFWTRGGHVIPIPNTWRKFLPDFDIDCEIYAGRCRIETVSRLAVQFGKFNPVVVPVVIDAPQAWGNWLDRIESVRRALRGNKLVRVVTAGVIESYEFMNDTACQIILDGGEGIVMRNPKIKTYEIGRTENALRLKA
jgi:hypothetical protein